MLAMNAPKARWLQVESPSRFSLLFAHDLFWKTATHFSRIMRWPRETWTAPGRPAPSVNPAFLPDRVQERARETDGKRRLSRIGQKQPNLTGLSLRDSQALVVLDLRNKHNSLGCALPAQAPFDASGMG
jgi:hypothetical protein